VAKGAVMLKTILFVLVLYGKTCYAISETHANKLKDKKLDDLNYEELAHENVGCPENSECSEKNGVLLSSWKKLLKQEFSNSQAKAQALENFRMNQGIPVQFLLEEEKEKKSKYDPIIWDSQCRHHNPIEKNYKIVRGIKFFKNNPKDKELKFVTAIVDEKTEFEIPYGEQGLLVWQNNLIVIQEYDDILYHLAISPTGVWKIINVPLDILQKARMEREPISCPSKNESNRFFQGASCSRIWNEDSKKLVTLTQDWACP
jgi:hypothetical protein